jgi:hypothetical protein
MWREVVTPQRLVFLRHPKISGRMTALFSRCHLPRDGMSEDSQTPQRLRFALLVHCPWHRVASHSVGLTIGGRPRTSDRGVPSRANARSPRSPTGASAVLLGNRASRELASTRTSFPGCLARVCRVCCITLPIPKCHRWATGWRGVVCSEVHSPPLRYGLSSRPASLWRRVHSCCARTVARTQHSVR